MTLTHQEPRAGRHDKQWGSLPNRVRALYVTTAQRPGAWLTEALAADSATRIALEESIGVAAGLLRLREETYDAVFASHEPGELDALELVEGLRAGGCEEPVIVLGAASEQELAALAYEVGADAYVCIHTATTRSLLWTVARAVERHQLIRENRRLSQAERHRLRLEHREAERLLNQQRALVRDLESISDSESATEIPASPATRAIALALASEQAYPLPAPLVDHYRELLRAYVIMGSGNLAGDMSLLAEKLVRGGVSARQTMQLHLCVLEDLVRGLGNRSARHVMARADLLVLEVMVQLSEGYRDLYRQRRHPPRQLTLEGFERPPAAFLREGAA